LALGILLKNLAALICGSAHPSGAQWTVANKRSRRDFIEMCQIDPSLPKEEVEAAHILIATSGRSEEEALKIIEDLQQNVTVKNFKEYAQTYSDDPGSKGQGGYLGWFGKGQMVPEFEQAAFSLKPNEISKPVKTQFGYHLILVLDTRKT